MRFLPGSLLIALLLAAPAGATDFTVTTTDDKNDATTADGVCLVSGGGCSLRAAIQQANASAGPDKVIVRAGTYGLSIATPLTINSVVTVEGAGADTAVVDAGGDSAVLTLESGAASVSGLTLRNSGGTGPGVYVVNGDHTLDGVAIRDNHLTTAGGGFGAGMRMDDGIVQLRNSAVTGNVATGDTSSSGGGISVGLDAMLIVERTTIADNSVVGRVGSATGFGGGIVVFGSAALRHVTLAGNSAAGASGASGGNLGTHDLAQPVSLEDSIVAGGTAPAGPNCAGKAVVPSGRNLDSGTSCGLAAPNMSNADPLLAPLGSHGGPTESMPPLLGSPVADAAGGCGTTAFDQRGVPAPSGPACDIGAAELATDRRVTLTAAGDGDPSTFVAKVVNAGFDPSPATVTFEVGAAPLLLDASKGTCSGTQCDLGSLAPGETASVTLVARASSATARVAGPVPDIDAANDAASASTDPAPTVTPTPPPGSDTTPPVLSGLKLGRLRAGKAARLSFTLSEAATVKVVVRRGKKRLGAVSADRPAGAGKLKLPRKRIKKGKLRFAVTATDAAGNASAAVVLRKRARPKS